MTPKMREIEPGDFVEVPCYIEDTELQQLEFAEDDIRRLRRGEFVAGSFLTRGVIAGEGGRVPAWKLDNLKGSILIVPDHLLAVSDGPTPPVYSPPVLGAEFYLEQLIDASLEEALDI